MLFEFRVKNFMSFRDEQVLSLLASRDRGLQETHTLETGLSAGRRALRSVALYGPNASGKSNLLLAMKMFRQVVRLSAKGQEGESLPAAPFAFDSAAKNQPTSFEAVFALEGIRYQYGFAFTTSKITEEWLLVYRSAKPQVWFSRQVDAATGQDSYLFSSHLRGQRKLWESSTRSNALFLSTATQLNSEQLRPIYRWISDWRFGGAERAYLPLMLDAISNQLDKGEILSFAQKADIGIRDFEIVREAQDVPRAVREILTRADDPLSQPLDVRFEHEAEQADGTFVRAQLPLSVESKGTLRMLEMAIPFLQLVRQGGLLMIDELDHSLHPVLVRALLAEYHRPNPTSGQLIFTTHNSSLLDADLLRRDQVYLIDKGFDLASHLEALSSFQPRKQEALEKGYLMGRYGAVPVLESGWF